MTYKEWKEKKQTQTQPTAKTYKEWKQQKNSPKKSTVSSETQTAMDSVTSRVNSWMDNYRSYLTDYNDRVSKRTGGQYLSDSDAFSADMASRKSALDTEADEIRALMKENQDYLDMDWVYQVNAALRSAGKQQSRVLDLTQEDSKFWASFNPTEEQAAEGITSEDLYSKAYNESQWRKKYGGSSYDDAQMLLKNMEDGEEKQWLENYAFSKVTAEELQAKRDAADNEEDRLKYQSLLNQKEVANSAEALGQIQMEGASGTILDELLAVAQMEKGAEKRARKKAVIKAMEASGIDPDTYYSLITGDSNFTMENLSGYIESKVRAGVVSVGKAVTGILDFTLGKAGRAIGWDNGIGSLDQQMRKDYNTYAYNAELYKDRMGGGKVLDTVGAITEGTVAALPQALMAMASAGTTTGMTLSENAAMATGNILTKAGLTTKAMLTNPSYWMSFGQTFSSDYEDALAKGADDVTAAFGATITSLINAGLEIGIDGTSGIQGLPQKLTDGDSNAILEWVKSSLEEGGEEVMQSFVNNAVSKIAYDPNTKLVEPQAMLEDFALGSAVGGLLGGGQRLAIGGINTGLNALYQAGKDYQTRQEITESAETFEAVQNPVAQDMPEGTVPANGQQVTGKLTAEESSVVAKLLEEAEVSRKDAAALAEAILAQQTGTKLTPEQETVLDAYAHNAQVQEIVNAVEENTDSAISQRNSDRQQTRNATDFSTDYYTAEAENAARTNSAGRETAEISVSEETSDDKKTAPEGGYEANTASYRKSAEEFQATGQNTGSPRSLEEASKKYGIQAEVMVRAYQPGQNVILYDNAYKMAYDMGKAGVSFRYLATSEAVSYLTDSQRNLAYRAGVDAAHTEAQKQADVNKAAANGGAGRRKGIVKGEDVTIDDLQKTFNDPQGKAYRYLCTVAEVTGIDIVLYRSKAGPDGKYQGAQGRYRKREPGKVYIDINAGLESVKDVSDLANYTILRTFAHEFTHFIENWNPIQYNELRKVVFDALTQRGEDVGFLIDRRQEEGMDYEAASREVVAEAMTDILPDADFVQKLAQKHKTIFRKLLDKLKEFQENLKAYFDSIAGNRAPEAKALKEQVGARVKYLDGIVEAFDQAAVQAVENYQTTVATGKEQAATQESEDAQYQRRDKMAGDPYPTEGVHWGIEAGLLTNSEVRIIWEAIANIEKRSYYYPRTVNGEYIVSADNALFFVRANYRHPSVNKIVRFNQEFMVNCGYAKELIIDARGDSTRHREALRDVADIFGEGFAVEYDRKIYEANAGKNGRRERKDRGTSDSGTEGQQQQRAKGLTDRDVLRKAANEALLDDLTEGERSALDIFQKRLGKLDALWEQKTELDKLYEKQQDGDRAEQIKAAQTLNRIRILDGQLRSAGEAVQEVEKAPVLKRILQVARMAVEQQERAEIQAKLAEYRNRYGTIPAGEKSMRPDELPKSTDGTGKVSRTARTVKGAGITPEEFADLIDAEVAAGGLSYLPVSNSKATENASKVIEEEGWETAKANWHAAVRAGKANADLSAMGALLLNNAAKAGDRKAWLEILTDYQIMGTEAAQAVQALRILKTLTPTDNLYMLRRSIKKMVKDLNLEEDVEIDQALVDEYNAAETDQERDAVIAKIQKDVAMQLPSTGMEIWTALRYVNMLGNFKTQGRNILGNISMALITEVKNTVAASLEMLVSKATGGRLKRTKSLAVNKELLEACMADFKEVESLALDGGKFQDAATSRLLKGIRDEKRVFKAPKSIKNQEVRNRIDTALIPMEKYRRITNWAMEQGDLLFSKRGYARALAGYLKANGVTGTDLSKVDEALLDEARTYAIREAQEATFRDHNALTEVLTSGGSGNGKLKKAVYAAGQGILPFRQTPANVLLRAEEYSPLGFLNALWQAGQAVKGNPDITGTQIINSFAKALTGTGLFVLGMIFSNLNWARGGPEDDDDKEAFDALNGEQNYALTFGGKSYTFDWLAPVAIPFFMGVNLKEAMDREGLSWETFKSSLLSLTDPMLQMSMLQGLNDTLVEIQYSDNSLLELGMNALTDYALQGMTNSLLSQLERGFEQYRMTTYTDKNKGISTDTQYTLGMMSAKIPGWEYGQIPYINAWGEEEESLPAYWNIPYNLLSPSYYSEESGDAVAEELYRLHEVQSDVNVFPRRPEKKLNFTDTDGVAHSGYNLSANEYVALARAQGQTQRKLVEDILGSEYYGGLTDKQKAKAIDYAYTYARESARGEVIESYADDYGCFSAKWMYEIQGDAAEAILRKAASGTTEKWTGLEIDTAVHVTEILEAIQPESGYSNVRPIQRMETVMADQDMTADEKETALREIMGEKLTEKYDAAQEMGVSADSFVKAYRKYQDTEGKEKKQTLTGYYAKAYGLSTAKAEELYDLFAGKK